MTDADEFEAFVRSYEDMVFGLAVRLLGRAVEAEDVAQTVFMKAFERFETVGRSATVGGWLKTVTTHLCLNHLSRYRARWRFFSEMARPDGEPDGEGYETRLASTASPAADLERADAHARLERSVRALPDHQRVPLVLFHFEQYSYQDIAVALGVSVGKVKTDIHRGREVLRQQLTVGDAAS